MKKLLCLFLTLTMVLSLGCISVFADSDYTEIRLANTETMATFDQSITLKAEGYNGTAWEEIPNNQLKFTAQSRFVDISADGVAKLNNDFFASFNKGASDGKSLSTPITATYKKTDGTVLAKKILLMFGSQAKKDGYSNSGVQTCDTVAESVPGLTGEKVFSSAAISGKISEYLSGYSTESFYEAWFYDPNDSQVGGCIALANDAVGNSNFYLYIKASSATQYFVADGVNPADGFSGNDSTGGKAIATRFKGWHQFVINLVTGKKLKAYLDGELVYEKELSTVINNSAMKILRIYGGGNLYYDKIRVMRSKTVPENTPTVNYANVLGTVASNSVLTADYEVIFPNAHNKANSTVQWQVAETYEKAKAGEFADIENETSSTYTVTDATKFYRIAVTPKSMNGENEVTGTVYCSEYVAGPIAPEAQNVTLSSINYSGATLSVNYNYRDANDDEEDTPVYKWYSCNTKDGEFTIIEGQSNDTFTITDDYATKYIKASVTPFSKVEPKEGTETFSNAIAPFEKPVVKDVKISGNYGIGETLTGSYTYVSDAEEDATILKWYRKNGDNIEPAKPESNKNDEYAYKYTVTNSDIDCEIFFEVTPICKDPSNIVPESGRTGTAVKSEGFSGAVRPVGTNARFSGSLTAENTVTVEYDYSHKLNIPEGNTQYRIYVGGQLKSDQKTLHLTADMAGKQIFATVTPSSAVEPKNGDSITTAIGVVGYNYQTPITVPSGGTSYGGGGGGSYSSAETAETKALRAVKKAIVLLVNSNNSLVNGANKNIDTNTFVAPFIENSRTLLPLRFIAESLGATVEWNDATREIKIINGSTTVIMHLDSDVYYVNGVEYKMDVVAKSVSGRTMISVRYISESLGKQVFWDDKGLIVVSDNNNIFNSKTDSVLIDALINKLK